ncbi:hypothetical protein SOVF_101190 [Spinacia oleracea]|nr:hypothetical protein SOVF_101190 [Spinacia oleracea]
MPRHTRRKLAERSAFRATMEDASDDEAAATNVPEPGMVPRRVPTFDDTGWRPSDLAFRPEFHLFQRPWAGLADGEPMRKFWFLRDLYNVFSTVYDDAEARAIWMQTGLNDSRTSPESKASVAALWSVLEIWAYEHFSTLAPARTGVAAYPYAASWVGAVRINVSLATFRRALRVLPVNKGEEGDRKDIPYAGRVIRYVDSDGEQVEVTVPVASSPHWRSYDAVLEQYATAPRVRVRPWMLVIDSLKMHCVNLTKKLTSRDREERRGGRRDSVDREPPVDTLREQDGPSLGLGLGSGNSTRHRNSDVDRGAVPFTYAEPTRHSVGGLGSQMPFTPPPGPYFGASSSQPCSAESWAYWHEMERMGQARAFKMQRQFMAIRSLISILPISRELIVLPARWRKGSLTACILRVLASFRFVKLYVHFILAALEVWDPNHHIFRFGNNEVCPLLEEFSAILGWPFMMEPCIRSVEEHFFLAFQSYLGLKPPLLSAVVYGRAVDLSLLVTYFAGLDVPMFYRFRALSFCIFARFLFSKQGFGNGDASLIEIVEQFASGRDPMPLVIGETLMGLDMLKSDPSALPLGSPVRLMERLMLVAPPENMESYNRKGFTVRPKVYDRLSLDEWRCALPGVESCVRLVVPWWGIASMRHAPGSTALRVPSLTMLAFYSPARVMRQYGLKQEIPDCAEEHPKPVALNVNRLDVWRWYWVAKPFLNIQFPTEPATLSAGYIV